MATSVAHRPAHREVFHFVPRCRLTDGVASPFRELDTAIPWRYFDTKHG
jgi:hypothetical protein